MATQETIPFNFDEIYSSVKDKFEAKGYDVQEGSNVMQLTTAMSYLVSMLNANTAINVNESILTLARKRTNVLTDARLLGYEQKHITSFIYEITLKFQAGSYTIPKYTEFKSGDYTYYYMGENIDLIDVPDNYEISINIKEGILKKYTDNDDLNLTINTDGSSDFEQYYVDIPFQNVEDNGVEVFVNYTDSLDNEIQEYWTKSQKFMIDLNSINEQEFVRLDVIEYRTPRIFFKLGQVGRELDLDSNIQCNILISSGSLGAVTEEFTSDLDCVVTHNETPIQSGDEEESLESVKYNAPLFHNSANRAITKNDYISICNRHSSINSTSVWDGNSEFPHKLGHIWFTFKPDIYNREFITENEYNKSFELSEPFNENKWYLNNGSIISNDSLNPGVWDVLEEYKIPTLIFHNRHPLYVDFDFDINIIRYPVNKSEADINSTVFNKIDEYFKGVVENGKSIFENRLEGFNKEFFMSNLIKRIDQYLTDITGFNISLKTNITLSKKHIIGNDDEYFNSFADNYDYYNWAAEDNNKDKVMIYLDRPFETLYNNDGTFITENLPVLIKDGLTIDFENMVNVNTYINDFDIYYNEEIVGKYRVFNKRETYILVELFVVGDNYSTGFTEDEIDGMNIQIKNNTDNISFIKNMIPRLKSVKFN